MLELLKKYEELLKISDKECDELDREEFNSWDETIDYEIECSRYRTLLEIVKDLKEQIK